MDDVINFYLKLIHQRHGELVQAALAAAGLPGSSPLDVAALPRDSPLRPVYMPTSFFWPKLHEDTRDSGRVVEAGYCYAGVARWTKKINVFECKALLIPVNYGNTHWAMAIIRLHEKRIEVYDSLRSGGRGDGVAAKALLRWLRDEHAHKKPPGVAFDEREWWLHGVDGNTLPQPVPQQSNGIDCGVFMLMFADCLAAGHAPAFAQADIPLLRSKIGAACLAIRLPVPA
jgi:sentrin-specific protease 1